MNANLFAVMEARIDAQAPLFFFDDGTSMRYGEMLTLTARYANVLAAHGVGKGDRVASQVEKSVQAFCLYLASLRMGAIYLPLNMAYQLPELAYFFKDAGPSVFIHDPATATEKVALAASCGIGHCLSLDEQGGGSLAQHPAGENQDFTTVEIGSDEVAAILYTSGTTGKPKGVMISHGNLVANGEVLVRLWGFTAQDVQLHALPIFHAHGLFLSSHCALLSGSAMIFQKKFVADKVVAMLPRATVMMGVPTFYTRLLDTASFTREASRNIRLFISGSAPLLPETSQQMQQRTGQPVLERYGMTESLVITSNPLIGERRVGTVGLPVERTELRVVDEAGDGSGDEAIERSHDEMREASLASADASAVPGAHGMQRTAVRELPRGVVGAIQIRGPAIMKGYWNNPQKTVEEMTADGWFKTGDLGVVSDDGYLTLVGRSKDLIISGGYNVYPKEVELALNEIDGIDESAVIGIPDRDFGEAVVAVIVSSGTAPTLEQVCTVLKQQMANYKLPKKLFVVPEFPRNAMGKILKNVLRETFAAGRP